MLFSCTQDESINDKESIMQPNNWEIIILKPTSVFLTFLKSQLPDVELPKLRFLQIDRTAYVIAKQQDDEETLNEIERHFITMFRHEISRCIGIEYAQDITASFLDFLCCFKFEMHSRVLWLEPTVAEGRQLICVKPRSILLKWMRKTAEGQNELTTALKGISLAQITENATVIVKNFTALSDVKPFVKDFYPLMFEAEMSRMQNNAEDWPTIDSYQVFSHYFTVEAHTQLLHLY